jgi:hypothetical protein
LHAQSVADENDGEGNNVNKATAASSDDPQQQQQRSNGDDGGGSNNWLEEWAMEGAKKIAQMDIHERTQRALLAEMTEDKIYELNIALEELVDEDSGEIPPQAMPAAKEIAQQTRSLQLQYRDLVTGGPSTILQAMASLKSNDSSN